MDTNRILELALAAKCIKDLHEEYLDPLYDALISELMNHPIGGWHEQFLLNIPKTGKKNELYVDYVRDEMGKKFVRIMKMNSEEIAKQEIHPEV